MAIRSVIYVPASPRDTLHFDIGQIKTPVLATPGIPDPSAMAIFGRLNIPTRRKILVNHIHQEKTGGGGATIFELWRRRSGVFTQLTTVTLAAGSDTATAGVVPAGDLAILLPDDYLFAQATALQSGAADGYTFDIHFRM